MRRRLYTCLLSFIRLEVVLTYSVSEAQLYEQPAPAARVAPKPEIRHVPETPVNLEAQHPAAPRLWLPAPPGLENEEGGHCFATAPCPPRYAVYVHNPLVTLTRGPGPRSRKEEKMHNGPGATGPVCAGWCPQSSSGLCAVAQDLAVEKPENGL